MAASRSDAAPLTMERTIELLQHGEIDIRGYVPWSSNSTLLVSVQQANNECLAVYKPAPGEQPLWDFDRGTLCRREVAAYRLSSCLGWPNLPPVALRDGPLGEGSLQLFIDHDPDAHYFALRERPELTEAFRRIVLFDEIVNNADRKAGHILLDAEERIWAIDQGLTFHAQPKLRTVVWDYAGQRVPRSWITELWALHESLAPGLSLSASLGELLTAEELRALRERLLSLIRRGTFVSPDRSRRNTPYPLI